MGGTRVKQATNGPMTDMADENPTIHNHGIPLGNPTHCCYTEISVPTPAHKDVLSYLVMDNVAQTEVQKTHFFM